jgi:hypothetical protein
MEDCDRTIQTIKTHQLSNIESAIESLEANVTPIKGAKHSFHLGLW